MRRVLLVVAFAAAALAAAVTPAHAATPGRVTIIGDSVLTAVEWNGTPYDLLRQNIPDLDLQIGVCRRLVGESCPFDGTEVPTLVDLVDSLGNRIGDTVVVEVGYNDYEDTFPAAVEQSIDALLAQGVSKILWVNMHIWQQQYIQMNADLDAAARSHPQMTIVDWASASNNQYSWFQGDGVHLLYDGAIAMAKLLNTAILQAIAPPPPPPPPVHVLVATTAFPAERVGRAFSLQLAASGGTAPYRWSATRALPAGVHLLANGTLEGRPRRAGTFTVALRVADAKGNAGSATLRFVVSRRVRPARARRAASRVAAPSAASSRADAPRESAD